MQMLHDSVLGFGLEELLDEHVGLLRISDKVLLGELYQVLPREQVILGLDQSVGSDPEVVRACEALSRAGYRLALDDAVGRPGLASLAPLASVLVVDVARCNAAKRQAMVREFTPRKTTLLATGVDSRSAFAQVLSEGFTLFEGQFGWEPELRRTVEIPAVKRHCVQLMAELHRADLDFTRLTAMVTQEVALTVKLLRFMNSAWFGWPREVTSVEHALRVLGERSVRKWGSLVALSVLGDDRPPQLVTTSLVRARLAELLAAEAGLANRRADFFLVGVLSTLDALLGRPLADALAHLPLSAELRNTLLGQETRLSAVWGSVLAYERAQWDELKRQADGAGLSVGRLPALYRQAVLWVDRINRA